MSDAAGTGAGGAAGTLETWEELPHMARKRLFLRSLLPRHDEVNIVVQLLGHVQLFVTPWTGACQAPLSFTVSQSLLKLLSIESVMPSKGSFVAPFSSCPQCFPMSWLFKSGSQSIGASASVLPTEYSELPSFRIDRSYVIGISVSTLLFHFDRQQDTM